MESYNHYHFSAQRHRVEKVQLDPPLLLSSNWARKYVGYPPKIHQSQVFLSFLNGKIEAFEEATGETIWAFQLPNGYNPSTSRDGEIVVVNRMVITRHGDQLFLIDASTGHLLSQQTVPNFDIRASVCDGTNLISIFVDRDLSGYCSNYDILQHVVLWKYKLQFIPDYVTTSVNRIFLSDKRGFLTCLSKDSGKVVWSATVKELGRYKGDREQSLKDGRVVGVSIAFGDLIIVPVMANHIATFESNSGRMRWSQKIKIKNPITLELYADGRIYIVDHEYYYCLDAATGNIVFSKNVGEKLRENGIFISTYPAVTKNYLYVADIYDGGLVAMDRLSGDVVGVFNCRAGIPIYHAPVVINDRLYVLDVEGNIYVFEQAPVR